MVSRYLRTGTFHVALVGVIALCCTLLAACGGTTGATEGISTTSSSTSTAAAASTASVQAGATATTDTGSGSGSGSGSKPLSQMMVYVGTSGGTFFAVNAGTGKQIWKTPINGTANKPTVNNGAVFVTTSAGYIYAFNASNGHEIWHEPNGVQTGLDDLAQGIDGRPSVLNGTVYLASHAGSVYSFDTSSGQLRSHFKVADGDISGSVNVQSDGTVYTATTTGLVYALNGNDLSPKWSNPHNLGIGSEFMTPTVSNGLVFIGADNGWLYALNTSNGSEAWHFMTGGQLFGKPAVDNGTVFVGSNDQYLYAINIGNHQQRWRHKLDESVGGTPAVANGMVFVTTSKTLYALNEGSGNEVWHLTKSAGYDRAWPVINNNVLFIGASEGNLYALNLNNHSNYWSPFNTGDPTESPTIG